MLNRWPVLVAVAFMVALVASDLASRRVANHWQEHSMTAGVVSGLLLLAVTVLVIDGVLRRREERRTDAAIAGVIKVLLRGLARFHRDALAARTTATSELSGPRTRLVLDGKPATAADLPRDVITKAEVRALADVDGQAHELRLLVVQSAAVLVGREDGRQVLERLFDALDAPLVQLATTRDPDEWTRAWYTPLDADLRAVLARLGA